jgi:carbon storage regulator CsrA
MLVLSRRLHQKIKFPATRTTVQIVGIKSGSVRLGIEAPPEVIVLRDEVPDRAAEWGPAEADSAADARLHQVLGKRLRIAHGSLALLRHQIQDGLVDEAAITIDKLDEDLLLLQDRLAAMAGEPLPAPPPLSRKTQALLVEDNANERELLATFLRLSGLDVITADDGAVALDYLQSHELPDMVLLDMGLPRCDGQTVVRNVRRDPSCAGLKIFAVTGHVPEEFDLASGPSGVNRWFHKPINPAELIHSLNEEVAGSSRSVQPTRGKTTL